MRWLNLPRVILTNRGNLSWLIHSTRLEALVFEVVGSTAVSRSDFSIDLCSLSSSSVGSCHRVESSNLYEVPSL